MATTVLSEVSGSIWKVLCKEGDEVAFDQELMILESMKMEIPLSATVQGVVESVLVAEGAVVAEGDPLVVIR